jgi:hypothetical protein
MGSDWKICISQVGKKDVIELYLTEFASHNLKKYRTSSNVRELYVARYILLQLGNCFKQPNYDIFSPVISNDRIWLLDGIPITWPEY